MLPIPKKYLLAIIPLLIVGIIIYFLSDIVTYILLAWVVSMIGAPIVVRLRPYLGKNLSAIATLSLFVLGFLILLWVFIPPLVNQAENLSKIDYTKVVSALEEPIKDWEEWLIQKKLMLPIDTFTNNANNIYPKTDSARYIFEKSISVLGSKDSTMQNIQVFIQMPDFHLNQNLTNNETESKGFFTSLQSNINEYMNPIRIQAAFSTTVDAFGDIFIGFFSIFFIGFFFLREQGLFDRIITSMVPLEYETQSKQAVNEISILLIRYFIGISFQVILVTMLVAIPLALLGIKNALLIGFFAGVLNVIPYIGPIIGLVFGFMITLSSYISVPFYTEMIPILTNVIIVFICMQIIDNIILQPNIFSKSVKAHPLEIFLIVLIGAKIGDITGMVLAIPFYTAFRVIAKVFLSEFKIIQKLTKNI